MASFDAATYDYRMRYIRPDLKTELSGHESDVVVHRSIALFRRPYAKRCTPTPATPGRSWWSTRTRPPSTLPLGHRGVIVRIKTGNEPSIPSFADDRFDALFPAKTA